MTTKIITDSNNDLTALITNLNKDYDSFQDKNVIIDISNYKELSVKDLNIFLNLSKEHRKNKKSFVIVISDFDFNKASDKITIVPTLQEAHDIIEMEEIERDLGF